MRFNPSWLIAYSSPSIIFLLHVLTATVAPSGKTGSMLSPVAGKQITPDPSVLAPTLLRVALENLSLYPLWSSSEIRPLPHANSISLRNGTSTSSFGSGVLLSHASTVDHSSSGPIFDSFDPGLIAPIPELNHSGLTFRALDNSTIFLLPAVFPEVIF